MLLLFFHIFPFYYVKTCNVFDVDINNCLFFSKYRMQTFEHKTNIWIDRKAVFTPNAIHLSNLLQDVCLKLRSCICCIMDLMQQMHVGGATVRVLHGSIDCIPHTKFKEAMDDIDRSGLFFVFCFEELYKSIVVSMSAFMRSFRDWLTIYCRSCICTSVSL